MAATGRGPVLADRIATWLKQLSLLVVHDIGMPCLLLILEWQMVHHLAVLTHCKACKMGWLCAVTARELA